MNKLSTASTVEGIRVYYHSSNQALSEYLSPKEIRKYQDLLEESQINPKKAYQEALTWEKTHTFPQLDNLLTQLHLLHRNIKKSEDLIRHSYEKYPHYFFAKINYADQCLRSNKLHEIPSIFPSFNLQELFPNKKEFHVSEFRGFMVFAAHYHLKIRNKEQAERFYKMAYEADPAHLSVMFLEKKLFKKKFHQKLMDKILTLARIR